MKSPSKATLILYSLLCASSLCAQTSSAPEIQQQAASYYRDGNYKESARLYKRLAEMQPNDVEVQEDLMWALWSDHQTAETVSVASNILSLKSDDLEALNMLGRAYQASGNSKQAIETYEKVLKQDPENPQVKMALAALYKSQNNLAKAEKLLGQAAEVAPGNAQIYPSLAKVQGQKGDYKSAAASWEKASAHSKRSDYKFEQAKALAQAGNQKSANAIYRQLLRDKKENRRALDALVNDAIDSDRLDEAAELLENNLKSAEPGDDNRLFKLAQLYGSLDRVTDAVAVLDRLLDRDPEHHQALLLKGDYLYHDLRNYEEAESLYEKAAEQTPDDPKIFPKLATTQYLQGSFSDAAGSWTKAVQLSPGRTDYKFHQAQSLYFSKQYDKALPIFYSLLKDTTTQHPATDFLLGDFVARGDVKGAAAFLEQSPIKSERLFELAGLYRDLGNPKKSLSVVDKQLSLHPDDAQAWLLRAVNLTALGKKRAVLKLYEKLHRGNPTSTFFMTRLAEAEYNVGHKDKAISYLRDARKFDPTNPYLLLREANYLFDDGHYEEAKKMVKTWLESNNTDVSLSVLVYHGLTPFSRDPLLYHPYHLTTGVFEEQIRSLKDAGFNAVTPQEISAWIKKGKSLPKHPVLIAFDDDRLDSFKNADPILQKYGMKATMFLPLGSAERNLPNYASWNEVDQWKNTGRWNIQAHGGERGHTYMVVNDRGDKALYLTRRMWLADSRRQESVQEWRRRSLSDHESAKQTIAMHTGNAPVAFAFPESDYGQYNPAPSPSSQDILNLAKNSYDVVFHEDEFGMNVKSQDPGQFARLMPTMDQAGNDLVRHVLNQNPYALMRQSLLKWALWQEKPREAYYWLDELKRGGASEDFILKEEARIHASENDLAKAQELLDKASRLTGTPANAQPGHTVALLDNQTAPAIDPQVTPDLNPKTKAVKKSDTKDPMAESLEQQTHPKWHVDGEYSGDNRTRRAKGLNQYLEFAHVGNTAWRVTHRLYDFEEEKSTTVTENAVGLGVNHQFGLFSNFDLQGMAHIFSGELKNTYSVLGDLDTNWTDYFRTQIKGGRAPVYTARALNQEITEAWGEVNAEWNFFPLWRIRADGTRSFLSDENRRTSGIFELSRYTSRVSGFRIDYRLTLDNTELDSPSYYSPHHLVQHQIGFDWPIFWQRDFQCHLAYLPGVGKEDNTKTKVIHNFTLEIRKSFGERLAVGLAGSAGITPTYRSAQSKAFLELRL